MPPVSVWSPDWEGSALFSKKVIMVSVFDTFSSVRSLNRSNHLTNVFTRLPRNFVISLETVLTTTKNASLFRIISAGCESAQKRLLLQYFDFRGTIDDQIHFFWIPIRKWFWNVELLSVTTIEHFLFLGHSIQGFFVKNFQAIYNWQRNLSRDF